ncbi:MAG: hypothetical protein GXZ01_00695 [Clostridiaceae bacterium]|nr:hypothetical protein [Clostridiaceae bacterium]
MMSKSVSPDELRHIGKNCSQYQQQRRASGVVMGLYQEEGISCVTCKNWSGNRCLIDAFDNVAANLGLVGAEE